MIFEQVDFSHVVGRPMTKSFGVVSQKYLHTIVLNNCIACQIIIIPRGAFQTIPGRLLFKFLSLGCQQKETGMNISNRMQTRLKVAIQRAIWETMDVDGGDRAYVKNTDVVEALLEVVGVWSSIHSFETYSRIDLAMKHAMTIKTHIEKYEPTMKSGKKPFDIIPYTKIN
jgi:hypothetical protein